MGKGRSKSYKTKFELGYGVIDLDHPENYKPWIETRELSCGSGRRHMFNDYKYPKRIIHLMSDLELKTYEMLRTNEYVKELFEQYPLDLELTLCIAQEYGIKHPYNPKEHNFNIMTTDFLALIEKNGERYFVAYAVKTKKDLEDVRTRKKLFLEKEYWSRQGIEWFIINEDHLKEKDLLYIA